jgi:hypothetical protein
MIDFMEFITFVIAIIAFVSFLESFMNVLEWGGILGLADKIGYLTIILFLILIYSSKIFYGIKTGSKK